MRITTLIMAASLGCGAIAAHLEAQAAETKAATATQSKAAQVDPKAVAALAQMSAYLRSIPNFQITLQTQRDDVDVYGQLITLSGGATYKVRRPDAFAIDLALPALAGQYVYDGKTVSVYDAKAGSYATYPAPQTIRETLELAEDKYGATVPLDDLFRWSAGDDRTKVLTAAHFIDKVQLGSQTANHYAFRQPGIDWQIWIADGDKPLPLRVIIVASDDPAKPQFQADLAWDTSPQFSQTAFAFTPPPNARAIDTRTPR
jgi:hypothetical protein